MNINDENTTSMSQPDCGTTSERGNIHKRKRILNPRWGLYTTKATRSGEKISEKIHDLQTSKNVKKLRKIDRKGSTNDSHRKRFKKKKNYNNDKKTQRIRTHANKYQH